MSQLLLNMAQQAVKNPSLMAGFIDKYTRQSNSTWAEVAVQLQISPAQLARLALCRQPNGNTYSEVQQIADYVNMSPIVLRHFFEKAQNEKSATSRTAVKASKTVEEPAPRNLFSSGNNSLSKKYLWPFGMALVLLLLVSAFVVAQPTAVSEATLIVNNGEATITRAGSDKSYTAVSGEAIVVTAGDTVTTDAVSTAQLHLADGGSVDLLEATSVEITELVTTEESYQVTLTMLAGRTLNRVVHLLGVNDHYEVRSPSSTASVRGTVFTVDILSQESTYFSVDEGVVQVTMGDQSVDVKAGFEITAVIGQLLIVKPQHQEVLLLPTPAPTPPAEPTAEAAPTAQPTEIPVKTEVSAKGAVKIQEGTNTNGVPALLPPAIGSKINPDLPTDGNDSPSDPDPDPADDPEKDPNGGNPHDGMTVPGSPPADSSGNPPAGGAEQPGQGGTPPGQTDNPGNGDGNSGDNGNSGGNGGGKKDD